MADDETLNGEGASPPPDDDIPVAAGDDSPPPAADEGEIEGDLPTLRETLKKVFLEWKGLSEKGEPDPNEVARLKGAIDRAVWDVLVMTAREGVKDRIEEELRYSADERIALDYALFGFGVLPFEARLAAQADRGKVAQKGVVEVLSFSQVLARAHRIFIKVREWRDVQARRARIEARAARLVRAGGIVRGMRDRFAEWALAPGSVAGYRAMERDLDRLAERYWLLDRENRTGGFSAKEKRLEYISLKGDVQKILDRRRPLTVGASDEPRLAALEARLRQVFDDRLRLDDDLAKIRDEAREITEAVQALKPADAQRALKEVAGHYRLLGRMCSQRAKSKPLGTPLAYLDLVTPRRVLSAMELILEFDPDLFGNRQVKREGLPSVHCVPGFGFGIFDYTSNALVVPAMSPRDALASVASAVIMYRDDIDNQHNDRKLITSYADEIPDNKKVRSKKELRERLTKDYIVWMTKESFGNPIFPRETRDWFERNIAPKLKDPKIPFEYRGLTQKELRERVADIEDGGPRDAEEMNRLGVLYAMLEEGKAAMSWLEKAIASDPDAIDVHYNLGVVAKREGHGARARECLAHYVKVAPQSWWSSKAKELVMK